MSDKKMTDEEARVLESIAAKLLVMADERDWEAFSYNDIDATSISVLAKLSLVSPKNSEVLVDEVDLSEGTVHLYTKNNDIYTDVKTSVRTLGQGVTISAIEAIQSPRPIVAGLPLIDQKTCKGGHC